MMELSINNSPKMKLYDLLYELAFRYSPEPTKLAYGGLSNYFFDVKQLMGDPEGSYLVAAALYQKINEIGGIKSVGGLESGSISIAHAISSQSRGAASPLHAFYVRKEQKKGGAKKWIEGCFKSPAVVVDDVITTGTSALQAIDTIRKQNPENKVECLITVVYRGTPELAKKIEQENNLKFVYIFHETDFTSKYEKEHPKVLTH
jgi:orotate phosphoribosyltransferase